MVLALCIYVHRPRTTTALALAAVLASSAIASAQEEPSRAPKKVSTHYKSGKRACAPSALDETAKTVPRRKTSAELKFLRNAKREIAAKLPKSRDPNAFLTLFVCLDKEGAVAHAEFAAPPASRADGRALRRAVQNIKRFPRPPMSFYDYERERIRMVVARYGDTIHIGADMQ